MDFLMTLLNAMPGAVAQGLIWGIMGDRRLCDLPDS